MLAVQMGLIQYGYQFPNFQIQQTLFKIVFLKLSMAFDMAFSVPFETLP